MKVAVGSKNPVKVQAVKLAFEKVWPNEVWEVEGIDVDSEVSSQPKTDEESLKGARNRARKALKERDADFGVGIEGGLSSIQEIRLDGTLMVVVRKDGKEGVGTAVRVPLPDKMYKMIEQGMELGEVDDVIFKKNNSKQQVGHYGLMTNGVVSRTEMLADGVIMALVRFIHEKLFEEK